MIGMRVSDDGVFDRGRVETQLFQPAGNFFFDGIVKDRVDRDDAFRRRDGPHGILGLAEEVQVVEHLHRFGIPR